MSNEETKRKLLQKDYICSTPTNPCIICTQIFAKTEFFD